MNFEPPSYLHGRIMYARSVGDNNCAIVVTDTFLARLPNAVCPARRKLNQKFAV